VLNVANGSHVDAMSHIVGCVRDGDIYMRSRAIVTVLEIATSPVPVRFDQLSLVLSVGPAGCSPLLLCPLLRLSTWQLLLL
jgi:hypothetical protein